MKIWRKYQKRYFHTAGLKHQAARMQRILHRISFSNLSNRRTAFAATTLFTVLCGLLQVTFISSGTEKSLKQSPVNLLKTFRKMTASAKAQMIFIFCGESLHCFRKSTAVQPLCIIFTDFPAVRYRPDCQHPKVWLNICFSSHEKY